MVLAVFALLISIALTVVNRYTQPAIEYNRLAHLQRLLSQVLPTDLNGNHLHDNKLQDNQLIITDPVTDQARKIYIASKQSNPVAVVITASAPDGYSGAIQLLVGILPDGQVSGVRVTGHTETPGLGDDIELDKSDWILQFNEKSLKLPITWAVQRDGGDFDQLTGATITPRAIVREVLRTLQFFNTYKAQIFTP